MSDQPDDYTTIPEVTLLDMPPLGKFASDSRRSPEGILGLKELGELTFTVNFERPTVEFEGFVVRRRHWRGHTKLWIRNLTADARPIFIMNLPERGRRIWRAFPPGKRMPMRITFPPDSPPKPPSA